MEQHPHAPRGADAPVLGIPVLGILGGMSWHSTEAYYRLINEQVAAGLASRG